MVITVRDHVSQCYSNEDGRAIYDIVKPALLAGKKVTVSFKGISDVTSSFVNSAFVDLLDSFEFDHIRNHLGFVHTTPQINDMIRRRFHFEVEQRAKA